MATLREVYGRRLGWVGTTAQLEAICTLMSDAADAEAPANWPSEEFRAYLVDSDELIHTGSAADVFGADEFDPAKVRTVEMSCLRGDSKVIVKMTPGSWISYFVKGSPRWATETAAEVDRQLRKGRRWWHFLRGAWFPVLLGWFVLAITILIMVNNEPEDWSVWQIIAAMIPTFVTSAVGGPVLRRVMPAAEVIPADSDSRGRSVAVTLLAGVVLAAVVSIVANLATPSFGS